MSERKEYKLVGSQLIEKVQPAEEQTVDLAPALPLQANREEELEVKESGDGH